MSESLFSSARRECWFSRALFSGLVLMLGAWGSQAGDAVARQVTDPDYETQGEYVGPDRAMQVIARGDGEFDLVVYQGGLPGAGARPSEPQRLDGDVDVVESLVESMDMKRVDRKSPTLGAPAPKTAVVLFDGTKESVDEHWKGGRLSKEGWLMQGTTSRQSFRDYSMHLEFRLPWMPTKTGQARGNSGLYHQGRYETQILDSFGLRGRDNECGGIYGIRAPSINACLPPLRWQTYDVDFTAARFDDSGKKASDARMTVRLNGILIHDDVAVGRKTTAAPFGESSKPGPVYLQDHGNPVRFRNIWIVPRDAQREANRPIVPGFERFFAATSMGSATGGELLMRSLACDACHRGTSSVIPEQRGPSLDDVAERVRPDALLAMISDPHGTKPGTTMPDPWASLSGADRKQRGEAIASYLLLRKESALVDRVMTKDLARRGRRLYHETGCVACHASQQSPATPASTTVPLGDLARKYTAPSLAKFLLDPHSVRPGMRMPAMAGDPDEAFAIAAFLTQDVTVRQNTIPIKRTIYRGKWSSLPDFDSLTPIATDEVTGLAINDLKLRNNFGVVFETRIMIPEDGNYTFRLICDDGASVTVDGNELKHDGLHPATEKSATFSLAAGVYPIRIGYFDGGGDKALSLKIEEAKFGSAELVGWLYDEDQGTNPSLLPSEFVPDARRVAQGKTWFASSGCANCHALTDAATTLESAPSLDQADWQKGCLENQVRSPAVDFRLGAVQQVSIRKALKARAAGESADFDDADRVHLTMASLNCYACHSRDSLGGPEATRDPHFKTTTPEMGLEGRLPPPLDGVGDKLNDTYMATVLDNGANLRPYMKTRMPGFRYEPLKAFHESLTRLDRSDEMVRPQNSQLDDKIVSVGRQLCGNAGLSCIKCHSYGGEKGGGIGAIDMLNMPQRLRVEWFQRYMQDPTAYRPGTRMPNSFVDGKSTLVDVYGGDPILQIDAIWTYLNEGTNAKEPEGLKQGAILLAANQKPRLYRNFFTGVTARGIGVAYPEKVNLIWDAETMTLAKAWQNSFIDASMHWVGRGQGRQSPLGDAVIDVDPATPFAILSGVDSQWPSQTGRDLGYRFRGYRLAADGRPQFRYECGDYQITDTPDPAARDTIGSKTILHRTIEIDATEADPDQQLFWQPAIGKINVVQSGYQIDGTYSMSIEGAECRLIELDNKKALRIAIQPGQVTTLRQTLRW